MEFLRRAAAQRRVNHHWQLAVSRFYPQIHLAIQPLLPETIWRELPVKMIREKQAANVNPSRPDGPDRIPEVSVRPAPTTRADSPDAIYVRIPRAKRGAANEFTTLTDRLRRYTTVRRETSESASELVIQRVAHRAVRVEETLPGGPTMMIHRPAPAAIQTQRQAASESEPATRPPRVLETIHEAPWARAAAAPPMSIEYLTDQVIRQIDSRMVAMRERMGRI